MRPINRTLYGVFGLVVFTLLLLTTGFVSTTAKYQTFSLLNSPSPTEAAGGLLGSLLGELRCPINLTGEGPSWRGITIGKSSLDDLKALYSPYAKVGIDATPIQPFTANYHKGIYAVNFVVDVPLNDFQPQLKLPRLLRACIVDKKVAALVVLAGDDDTLPHSLEQLVLLMGQPTLISWHEDGGTSRLLHWPTEGMSAQVSDGVVVDYIYFYPFLSSKYANSWPMNSLLEVAPTVQPEEDQPTLDYFNFSAVELTLTVSPAWPTHTPHATIAPPTPSATVSPTATN